MPDDEEQQRHGNANARAVLEASEASEAHDQPGAGIDDAAEDRQGEDTARTGDDADGQEPDDKEESGDTSGQPFDLPTSLVNSSILGQLVLHYRSRDVPVVLDGASAIRAMCHFAEHRRGPIDELSARSSALAAWVVYDTADVLAMTWLPGLGAGTPGRVAIDPPARSA